MPPKRATKRKSAGGEPEERGNELAISQGSLSEPRSSTKRPKNEFGAKTKEDKAKEAAEWTDWFKRIQGNENTYYRREANRLFTNVRKSTKKSHEFLEGQVASLQPGEPETEPILENAYEIAASLRLEDSRKEGDDIFQQAQDALESCTSLLAWHKATEEALKSKAVDTSILATWKKDRSDVKELLAKGREHGGMITANYLAPGTFSPAGLNNDEAGEHEKKAASMFQGSQQTKSKDCWGPAALEQFEHFRSLVKSTLVAADADGHVAAERDGVSDSRRIQ
ncbi:hypothetical protein PG994_001264 [Apiospora phragmitis]|uniref:Uncharacterized protein n=1 Tax=Apiospora phragmitis TaxID=2905665 RepID=A0ABR1WT07_9PEZI